MKPLSPLLGPLLATQTATVPPPSIDIFPRFISYNIRLAVSPAFPPEPAWSQRLPAMSAQLNFETAGRPESLICMQEVLPNQLADLADGLGASWSHVGVGRDDGKEGGEFSPIFYRSDVWDLVANHTYWLSETPDVPGSKGWDAALPRIVTVAELRHTVSGMPLTYMCTHFDHRGVRAREESAKLLVKLAEKYAEPRDGQDGDGDATPVFLGGDLNIGPESSAYHEMVKDGAYLDIRDTVDPERVHGHFYTYTGFANKEKDLMQIDHVFVWRIEVRHMELLTYAVTENRFDDGLWISDHRPVIADVKLRT